jgi:hypothetical protein
MWQVLFLIVCVGMIFLSWPPFLYRRFSRDGYGRPFGRAVLWSFGVYLLAGIIAELTWLYPRGGLYPLLLLVAPLPFNAFCLLQGLLHASPKN